MIFNITNVFGILSNQTFYPFPWHLDGQKLKFNTVELVDLISIFLLKIQLQKCTFIMRIRVYQQQQYCYYQR